MIKFELPEESFDISARQALPSHNGARDLVFRYGNNTNSYVTLGRGFQHFNFEVNGERGSVAYVDTFTAWVGAAEPFTSRPNQIEGLRLFAEAAKKRRKQALILPVNAELAMEARAQGLDVFEIGKEPWLTMGESRYKSDFLHSVPAAKQLKSKGAVVEEFLPAEISADDHSELKLIGQRWLDKQKVEPLGFLNRLDPWALMHNKRYFRLKFEGQQVAFLAAVPIPARKAWYLVDLIRDPEAPVGATELLVIEATDILTKAGAVEVTLGMSPMVPVSEDEFRHHTQAYSILKYIFENSQAFYGFKSLFAYKEKFQPTRWSPVYLISLSGPLNWRMLYGLFLAHYPMGLLAVGLKSVFRTIRQVKITNLVTKPFAERVVLRTVPDSTFEYLLRMRATLLILFINSLFYILTTDSSGELRWRIYEKYGYSWDQMVGPSGFFNKILLFVMPAVLHSHFSQFLFNSVVMFLFVGLIEVVIGTSLMTTFYVVGSLLSNVLTTALIAPWLMVFNRSGLEYFLYSPDVGCSLGVLSCVGAFAYLTKYRKATFVLVALTSLIGVFFSGELMFMNHAVAAIVGYILAQVLFR